MSKFITKLQIEAADNFDDGKWVLTAALIYQSDVAGRTFMVPKGFPTNLASVPRVPIAFMLCGDTSDEAAAVHDYLYSSHEVTREMADQVLREASQVTGVPGWRRWLMWAGVRLGGASHWGKTP